jgi:hypothetical protein
MSATPEAATSGALYRYDPSRDPEALLSPEQAGSMLSLTPRKLAADRTAGVGIPYIRIAANRVRYRRADIIQWVAEQERIQNGIAPTGTRG